MRRSGDPSLGKWGVETATSLRLTKENEKLSQDLRREADRAGRSVMKHHTYQAPLGVMHQPGRA